MVGVIVRATSTIITVVVAVAVSSTLGDTASGRIWAAVLIAILIGLVESLLIWAPKHSALARRLLDPRSVHVGVWMQRVTKSVGGDGRSPADELNRFAVYYVKYNEGSYRVSGFAFDSSGTDFARWHSVGSPEFASDGHSMTYRFVGEIIGDATDSDDIERTGVTGLDLESSTGRVDHVGERRIVLFDIERVSRRLLDRLGLNDLSWKQLDDPASRRRLASAYAAAL